MPNTQQENFASLAAKMQDGYKSLLADSEKKFEWLVNKLMALDLQSHHFATGVAKTFVSAPLPYAPFDECTIYINLLNGSGSVTYELRAVTPTGQQVVIDTAAITGDRVLFVKEPHQNLVMAFTSYSSGIWDVTAVQRRKAV